MKQTKTTKTDLIFTFYVTLGASLPVLIIPWMVLQELDSLKVIIISVVNERFKTVAFHLICIAIALIQVSRLFVR